MTMNAPFAPTHDDETLARVAKALAHPARLALVRALSAEPCCCGHLVRDLSRRDMSLAQSTVSQHLRVLVEAGLVTRTACGVESYYTVNRDAVDGALAAFSALCNPQQTDRPTPSRLLEKA